MSKNFLGTKIKQIRRSRGLTQAQLAELAGANEKHISKIETGVYFPTYATLLKILNALDIKMDDIDFELNKFQSNRPFYIKAMQIIRSAKSENELEFYYLLLSQAKKGIEILEKGCQNNIR